MQSSQVEGENARSRQGGLLLGMCIMYSHASRTGQAGCISCSTWMNSAAEHAQVMLSKGQFELSQTGLEPLIGMLSRFHFSRALFSFTATVLSLFPSLSLSLSGFFSIQARSNDLYWHDLPSIAKLLHII